MIRSPAPALAFVLAALAASVLPTAAQAQAGRAHFARDDETQTRLDNLALYQRGERWLEAIDTMDVLLDRLDDPTATSGLYGEADTDAAHSLADEVQARLARWPARGIAAFRAAYEARARSLLARARGADPPRAPWEVVRFFPTEAAGEALALAAAHHLERGEAMLAIRALEWAGLHPDRPIAEHARAFRLALAWSILGRNDRAAEALARAGDAPMRVGGASVTPREAAATFAFARAPVTPHADWPTRGGAPARDAVALVAPTLGAPRLELDASCLAPTPPRRLARAARGMPPVAPTSPASGAGRLVAASAATIAAWDDESGELAWQFPDTPDPAHDDPGEPSGAGVHTVDGALYASTAGGVFRLDLRAGKLAWGYRLDPADEPFGARVTALSGPLVVGDRVLVVATRIDGDVRTHLLALDRATGAVVGTALLTTSSSPTTLGYGYPAAAPSAAAGELVLGTEHGAIVAIDPVTLAPRWGLRYPRHPEPVLARMVEERRLRAPCPVAIVGSVYCAAPTDSPYALGIDAATRGELWRHPLDTDETLYAACRDAVVVGGRSLRGLDPWTGLVRWELALGIPATDVLLVDRGELLVSAGTELLRLDRATGAIRGRRLVPHAGRLAPCAGGVAILGPLALTVLPPAPAPDGTLAGRVRALHALSPEAADAAGEAIARDVAGAAPDEPARREWARYARLRLAGTLTSEERARWSEEASDAGATAAEALALARDRAILLAALPTRDREREAAFTRATDALAAMNRPIGGVLAALDGIAAPGRAAHDTPEVPFPTAELARLLRAAPRGGPPAPSDVGELDPRTVDLAWLERAEVRAAIARDPARMRAVLGRIAAARVHDQPTVLALASYLADLDRVPPLAPAGSVGPRLAWKSALPTSLLGARELPVLGACAPAVPFPLGLAGDRAVQLRDLATGALVWREGGIDAAPLGVATVDDRGLVLFGGMLVGIDLATAEPCWGFAPGAGRVGADAFTGPSWRSRLDGSALVALACRPGAVYAAGSRTLARLDPATGVAAWTRALDEPPTAGCLVATARAVFVGTGPRTIAVFGADGAPRGALTLPAETGMLVSLERRGDDLLARCVASDRAHWVALDVQDETPRMRWTLAASATARMLPTGGRELVLDDGGELVVLDGATGARRWAADHRGEWPVARATAETLVVAWRAGDRLACAGLDLADGRRRWTASAPSGPVPADVVPIGDDRALVRAAEASAACLLADGATGTITEHRLPHHHARVERLLPAGSTLVVDTDAGLVGLALEPDSALRAELFRTWPHRKGPLVAPAAARALVALGGDPGAGARLLTACAREADGGWATDLRAIDLIQGGQEAAGDLRVGRTVLRARRFARPPVIDGQLNERWDPVASAWLDGHDAIRLLLEPLPTWAPWRGVSDHSLRLFLGWDDTYLYLAMRLRDERNTMFDEELLGRWSGDVVFFSFDPADDGGYDYNQHEDYAFWFYNPKPRRRAPPPANAGDRKAQRRTVDGVLTAIDWGDENHRTYELAIPWSLLKRFGPPAAGKRLGLDVLMLDDDKGTGCTRGLSLSPGNLLDHARTDQSFIKRFHPQRFPQVELVR